METNNKIKFKIEIPQDFIFAENNLFSYVLKYLSDKIKSNTLDSYVNKLAKSYFEEINKMKIRYFKTELSEDEIKNILSDYIIF